MRNTNYFAASLAGFGCPACEFAPGVQDTGLPACPSVFGPFHMFAAGLALVQVDVIRLYGLFDPAKTNHRRRRNFRSRGSELSPVYYVFDNEVREELSYLDRKIPAENPIERFRASWNMFLHFVLINHACFALYRRVFHYFLY